ncbi:uncharacterized protein LOC108820812 isoform X1 [Raphanus sativus]|uniref:Uncharacterized protein LOC108820812 isoform X1 n=1 Tax=Raphanus sativus TaxID=3726 RepID=A0A6J0KP58_RAPSA|nr:uncharacterized protein LOC108820812 isoform X1 [Raphanus sativus]
MTDPEQRLTALKKAYADTILNTAKEAAARVMVSERRARGFQQELVAVRDEALRTCLRLKQMYDSKVKEAEMMSLSKQQKIEELEAQLGEAEDIVGELRMELRESRYQLERLANSRQSQSDEENKPSEVVSLACEDSSNRERTVAASGVKPRLGDRDNSINRCSSYKENKDPCHHALPSILSRRRDGGDCLDLESLTSSKTEARKEEEEKENDMELFSASVTPSEKQCAQFTVKRKRKNDARSGSSSPEGGGGSSSSSSEEDESRNRRQKTGEKDTGYLDSFNTESSSRDSRRVAQVARQLLPFTEKKVLQENQSDDVS